jgi:hypothetical protein
MQYKQPFLIFLSLVALPFISLAQQNELDAHLQNLQSTLVQVTTGAKSYEQALKPKSHGSIMFSSEETDQKGGKVLFEYEFNLADVDPYTVKNETQKDAILVSFMIRNKQKLVKVSKNSEVQSYSDKVEIRAKDIDNAREISELIKKSIAPAEKVLASKLNLKGYDALVNWLTGKPLHVELGSKTVKQTFSKGSYIGSLLLKEVETDSKGATETDYQFNLADINLNSMVIKVSGNRIGVYFETIQKTKAINTLKGGKTGFTNDVTIQANDVEEARDIKSVLMQAAPLAQEKVKADNPKAGNEAEIKSALLSLSKDIKTSDKELSQGMEGMCVTTLTQTETTPKSTEKNVYTFNWMDLNPNITKIQTSGDRMYVELTGLDKKAVIMHYKNDKFEGYKNQVSVFTEDMEIARRLKFVTDNAIEKCKNTYKEPFNPSASEAFKWLQKNIGEVVLEETSIKQTFEPADASNFNKVKYSRISLKGNTSSEEIFEFNMGDINPTTLEVQVKGKWLYLKFETNFKAKIINSYKDGKILPYSNSVELVMENIESSRHAIAAFKKCIEANKSK